jgi:tetratricopeptide (TPR) repeat protein
MQPSIHRQSTAKPCGELQQAVRCWSAGQPFLSGDTSWTVKRASILLFLLNVGTVESREPQAWSLDGTPLYPPEFSGFTLAGLDAQIEIARDNLQIAPVHDPAKAVWLGRRLGYKWLYRPAIDVYSKAIGTYPRETTAMLHRHRGHRLITTRNFSKAEADLGVAKELIVAKSDGWEADGEPNQYNVPLSSKHFNIFYHLGLSKYLLGDFMGAASVYASMVDSIVKGGYANDESLAAIGHWHYMSLRRSGASHAQANASLAKIHPGMRMLDGGAYLNLTLLYKGLGEVPDLAHTSAIDLATLGYGVGNWHFYQGRREEAMQVWRMVLTNASTYWAAFGYIAAEAELHRFKCSKLH